MIAQFKINLLVNGEVYFLVMEKKMFKHGDFLKHKMCNDITWVALEVNQHIFNTTSIDVPKPGLYAFGDRWYGDSLFSIDSYGKVLDINDDFSIADKLFISKKIMKGKIMVECLHPEQYGFVNKECRGCNRRKQRVGDLYEKMSMCILYPNYEGEECPCLSCLVKATCTICAPEDCPFLYAYVCFFNMKKRQETEEKYGKET